MSDRRSASSRRRVKTGRLKEGGRQAAPGARSTSGRIRARGLAAAALTATALGSGACTPLDDAMAAIFGRSMRDQRSFDPYEMTLLPPEGTVPISAGNYAAGPHEVNLGQPEGARLPPPFTQLEMTQRPEVADSLTNPVPATPRVPGARRRALRARLHCLPRTGRQGHERVHLRAAPPPGRPPAGRRRGQGPDRRVPLRHDPGGTRRDARLRPPDRPLRPVARRQLRASAAGARRGSRRRDRNPAPVSQSR